MIRVLQQLILAVLSCVDLHPFEMKARPKEYNIHTSLE